VIKLIRRPRSMDSSALANAEYWLSVIFWVKLSAGLLVAIGVVFEFLGDWASRPYEKVVKEFHELQLKSMQAEADSAKAALVEAQNRIADSNKIAQQATQKAGELGVSVGTLNKTVDEQKARIKTAVDDLNRGTDHFNDITNEVKTSTQKSVEEMRSAVNEIQDLRGKLHDLTTDRTVSVIRLSKRFNSFGKIPFILAVSTDRESIMLASQITQSLEDAGWEWKSPPPSPMGIDIGMTISQGKPLAIVSNFRGISIEIAQSDLKTFQKPGEELVAALQAEGLKNVSGQAITDEGMKSANRTVGAIYICIGARN